MKTALIIHGQSSKKGYYDPSRSTPSNSHWLPWIQKQLLLKNCLAQTLEMPEPYYPDYEEWKSLFERFDVNENTMLIGHSRGGAFLMRWLSENKTKTDRVALVAPSMATTEREQVKPGFFDFKIDADFPSRTKGTTVFYSTDDSKAVLETVKLLKENTKGITFEKFADKGHFTFDNLGTVEFPELRDVLC